MQAVQEELFPESTVGSVRQTFTSPLARLIDAVSHQISGSCTTLTDSQLEVAQGFLRELSQFAVILQENREKYTIELNAESVSIYRSGIFFVSFKKLGKQWHISYNHRIWRKLNALEITDLEMEMV